MFNNFYSKVKHLLMLEIQVSFIFVVNDMLTLKQTIIRLEINYLPKIQNKTF